jgi:homoserine kinase type II
MPAYTQLNKSLIEDLCFAYSLGKLLSFVILQGGSENTNYRIETEKGTYVLTVCEQKSIEETIGLANLLSHLEANNFITTKIVANEKRQYVQLSEGKPILIKQYLDGIITQNLSENQLIQIGKAIGELHLIPSTGNLPKEFSYGKQIFHELEKPNINDPFIIWIKNMHELITTNTPSTLPKALIHGDIFYNNVIVEGNNIVAIMDFEEACHYYRIFDLGMAIIGCCSNENKIDFNKASYLMKGYRESTILEETEKELLQIYTAYAAAATAFWRFRQYRIRKPEKELENKHLEMQTLANCALESPKEYFLDL